MEIWKAINIDNYPLAIQQRSCTSDERTTRAVTSGRPREIGRTRLTQNTCISDAIKVWNRAPSAVTDSKSLYQAKKESKKFVKTLPI